MSALARLFLFCAALGSAPTFALQDPEPVPDIEIPVRTDRQDPPPKPEDPTPTPTPTPAPVPAPDVPVTHPPVIEPVPEVVPPPVSTPAAAPVPAASADYEQRLSEAAFEAEIARLVGAHPTRARRASLGKSRGGRDIALLALTEFATGAPDTKPGLLLVTGLDPVSEARPAGPGAAMYAARALLEAAERDPETAAWLATTSIYVIPAPDPDPTFATETATARACRLDRNFPSGWKPWSSETCAQGPYPLSEPETRALARFLSNRANIGGVLLLSRGLDVATEGLLGEESEFERILYGHIAAVEASAGADVKAATEALMQRSLNFTRESGSLAAFCHSRLSAFVWPLDAFGGAMVETPLGRAPEGYTHVARGLAQLAAELPRVACSVLKTERLRERLWKIDLEVANSGLLPTLPVAERALSPGSVWFEAAGGRVAQVGLSRGGQAEVNAVPRPPNAWLLGHLDGREKIGVFVIVEAAEGTNLEITLRTLRAGETKCATTLH